MAYIDGYCAAVPAANKAAYVAMAKEMAVVFRKAGATRVVEGWGDDVPEGKLTSFPMAVKKGDDEIVVFSWIEWPSRAVRDEGWKTAMADPLLAQGDVMKLLDGKRMIFGGFDMVMEG